MYIYRYVNIYTYVLANAATVIVIVLHTHNKQLEMYGVTNGYIN